MLGVFADLDDESKFCKLILDNFSSAPGQFEGIIRCSHDVNPERIRYSYRQYKQSLDKLSALLSSRNPDHYKRSGVLLHSLYQSKIISKIHFNNTDLQHLEAGYTRIISDDGHYILSFMDFYGNYHNEMLSFDTAYRCCATFEKEPRKYTFDYLHNICRHLRAYQDLTVDDCFMIFKSLMV